jgi:hypothetical protein
MDAGHQGSFTAIQSRARLSWAASGCALLAVFACGSGERFESGSPTAGAGSGGKAGDAAQPASGNAGRGGAANSAGDGSAGEAGATLEPTAGAGGALTCEANAADCNADPSDGCEASLSSAAHCGRCGHACEEPTTPFCDKVGDDYACTNPVEKLAAQRIELPCLADGPSAELCKSVASTMACPEGGKIVMRTLTMAGDADVIYDVTVRIRGVFEPKIYEGGADRGDHFYEGGAPKASNFNAFEISVSAPEQHYFLNAADATGEAYLVFTLDHTKVIPVRGGASVTLAVVDRDCAMVKNCQLFGAACAPYVIDDISPAPEGYNGQFAQLDVVKVTRSK